MIELMNVKPGDCFNYSIVYLYGYCSDFTVPNVEVIDSNGVTIAWSIVNNYFKAFVRLEYGKNEITIKTDNCKLKIVLFRFVNSNKTKYVRVLYVVCKDDPTNGEFQSPDTNSNKQINALKRICFNIELIQTFLSETLFKNFNMRKTFSFKSDISMEDTHPICETFYTKLELNKALGMNQSDLFHLLAEEIKQSQIYDSNCKYLAILSFTRYVPNENKPIEDIFSNVKGYCALGAEWLAVYGTPCLFSWAEELNDLEKCFTDSSPIDSDLYLNDTAFRNTFLACYSTTLGSLLHEFSHILDLGHNLDGIMNRGFDDLFNFFIVNFKKCNCYLNKLKIDKNNCLIDSLTESLVVTENKYKNTKETRLLKWAKIKQNYFEQNDIYDLDLNRNQLVFSLALTEKTTRFINSKKTQVESKTNNNNSDSCLKCDCMQSCFYNGCNLNILFYHKWLNNENYDEMNTKYFKLISIKNDLFEITSVKKIVSYELRTLKRSHTFYYELINSNQTLDECSSSSSSCFKINLNIDHLRQIFTNYVNELFEKPQNELFDKKFERIFGANENLNGFEFVCIDSMGNLFKKKFNFNSILIK